MAQSIEHKEVRVITKMEPSLASRVERVANDRFGTNRSLLIRIAVEQFISPIERELAEREAATEVQAA